MNNLKNVLSKEELTAFSLRYLYDNYGYKKYRMSKFEEYDLYVKNKDFLVSDNIITFTDTNGKLLALKPDVTLSIIKNTKDIDGVIKLYYNENVYRVSKGTRSYKEIMQAGLECLGDIDDNVIIEVLLLASKSLDIVSENNLLEISNLDIVLGVLNSFDISEVGKKKIFKFLGDKNASGVNLVALEEGLSTADASLLEKLVTVYGSPEKVIKSLADFKVNAETEKAIDRLIFILDNLYKLGIGDKVCVDFSVVNDMKYYNGIAFKGFVEGLPTGVLSGGQYDKLMLKMKKSSKAIGFAVYLDEIGKLG